MTSPKWWRNVLNNKITWKQLEDPRVFEVPKAEQSEAFIPGGSTPSQYALPEGAKELQDLIEYRNFNFALGNIFKACYRLGHCKHSDRRRDLRKIIWFANRELNRLENENTVG